METIPQRPYIRGDIVPFEEDILHELKGHRTINSDESNPHHFQETKDGKRLKRTRQQWSKYLCGMLNSGQGGTLYSGILDDGVVSGIMLTQYQKLHVELSLSDTLHRFNPPVPRNMWSLEFIPIMEPDDTEYIPDPSRRDPHLWNLDHGLRTFRYCWCDCNALAEFGMGIIYPFYIIQVKIEPWIHPANPTCVDEEIPPLYLAEDGECYIRKHATTERYTPVEMRELNEDRIKEAYSRMERRQKNKLEAGNEQLKISSSMTAWWCACLTVVLLVATQNTHGQGKTMQAKRDSKEACPLLGGVFVTVMRRIFNPGFHKQLVSEIEVMLTTTVLPDHCTLLIEETMPRGAYVDPDLVRSLRSTGLRTFIPAEVNVEAPEYNSEAHRVFIFRDLDVRENLRVTSLQIPVSLRYHKPSGADAKGNVPPAMVKIQNPRLMISCHEEDLLVNCSSRTVIAACDESGRERCGWLNMPYKINVPSVEVGVPVGNADHASVVVGVTTFITSGATIYLLIAMFRDVTVSQET